MNLAKLRTLPFVVFLFPFDLIVTCILVIADIVSIPLRFLSRAQISSGPADMSSVTVQILNWDGLALLKECLPSVVEAVRVHSMRTGGRHEVLVVDNGSSDGSVAYLQEKFANVRVITLDRNYGFSGGNNKGFKHVHTDVVVLLNNDMLVEPDFLQPLLLPFSDSNVFAVTSQIFFKDTSRRREETGKTKGLFKGGFFRLWHDDVRPEDEMKRAIPVFWAGGGSCAVDLRKLSSIGGFDSLYKPFYVEDTDISWQAWKRGWKCLLAPQSHVVHKHRGTSRPKFGDDFVDRVIRRNQFLFVWKNVTQFRMILFHLIALPRIHARAMLQRGPRFEIRSYMGSLGRLPFAVWRRVANLREYVVSDCDVLKLSR